MRAWRVMGTIGAVVSTIVGLIAWCVAANYIARITAGAQVRCQMGSVSPFSGIGLILWEFGSLLVFLLVGAGLLALVSHIGARKIVLGACAVFVLLFTWAYIQGTHLAMQDTADHGGTVSVPPDAQGSPDEACQMS